MTIKIGTLLVAVVTGMLALSSAHAEWANDEQCIWAVGFKARNEAKAQSGNTTKKESAGGEQSGQKGWKRPADYDCVRGAGSLRTILPTLSQEANVQKADAGKTNAKAETVFGGGVNVDRDCQGLKSITDRAHCIRYGPDSDRSNMVPMAPAVDQEQAQKAAEQAIEEKLQKVQDQIDYLKEERSRPDADDVPGRTATDLSVRQQKIEEELINRYREQDQLIQALKALKGESEAEAKEKQQSETKTQQSPFYGPDGKECHSHRPGGAPTCCP